MSCGLFGFGVGFFVWFGVCAVLLVGWVFFLRRNKWILRDVVPDWVINFQKLSFSIKADRKMSSRAKVLDSCN